MCVYLRTKFQVSSITLTSFSQVGGEVVGVILPLPPPQNKPLKIPSRLGLSNLVHDGWKDCFRKLKLLLTANRLIYLNISIVI